MVLKMEIEMPFARLMVLSALTALLSVTGCAHASVTPLRVRASDSRHWGSAALGHPLIVDFKAGERIPVSIQIDGEILATTPSPSVIWLTVQRDFSVRIQGTDIKTSLDGVHFDDKPDVPGHFQFGLQATRDADLQVVVHLTTPVHHKP
jgi:hypothetical protein